MLRVVGDRPDIVVAHRKIDAAIAICVSDCAARSQIVPNSVRIIAPVRMIVIEIPRPIADRRALPHGCLLRGHAARPAKGALTLPGGAGPSGPRCSALSSSRLSWVRENGQSGSARHGRLWQLSCNILSAEDIQSSRSHFIPERELE